MTTQFYPAIKPSRAWTLLLFLAVTAGFAQETQRQYLSVRDKDTAVPWQFFCTAGRLSGVWTNLPVPSQWDVLGFGTLNYRKDDTANPVEQGRYRHPFKVPANWARGRVFLVFDGVMTDTRATVNGQSAGSLHQGGFYRFKYEITPLVKFGGANLLEVTVDKLSANDSVNRAERQGDYWVLGGIFRPVYLEAVPSQFIDRVAIDARADGAVVVNVLADGVSGGGEIEAQILDLKGKTVGAPFSQMISGNKIVLQTMVSSPRQWTAETPNLYCVEVRLKQGGKVLHRVRQRFGFRTMEVRSGDGLYVNGRRVILKGCDRHSFWPESGRCLSEEIHRLDINTMKDMNMNAVRMSHYPPDQRFLDLCDELGLYVLDELAGWQKSYDTEAGRKLVEEMVICDVNHPSILFWDNGNEGGWNTALDGEFARWDPQQRKVLHPWGTHDDVNAAHYRKYGEAAAMCATNVIYMPTEFLHGLYDGGHGAGLEDYWNLMLGAKALGGGFLWALVDEGLKRPDTGKVDVAGNQAPDGIVGPYRQREGSFYAIKELWSPIQVTRDADNALRIENRFNFTDARECRFTWQLRRFGKTGAGRRQFTTLASGRIAAPAIPPGGNAKLNLKLPANWDQSDSLAVRVDDPTGRELWTWVWPLLPANRSIHLVRGLARQPAAASETADAMTIRAGDFNVGFSKQTGRLISVQRGLQRFSFANGPRLAIGDATLTNLECRSEGMDQILSATFTGDLKSVTWRVCNNGWVQCDYTFAAEGPKDFIGVVFDYPENLVKHKRWLGDGPYRVWQNRLRGVTLNVWENDYNNTITGWSDWVYPEFKGCFANVRWLQLTTTEGLITVVPEKIPFLQVLTPEFPPANLQAKTALSLPQAGLAFLHAIPPIGNKFHAAKDTGPQGQRFVARGEYTGSVSFYFGDLP